MHTAGIRLRAVRGSIEKGSQDANGNEPSRHQESVPPTQGIPFVLNFLVCCHFEIATSDLATAGQQQNSVISEVG